MTGLFIYIFALLSFAATKDELRKDVRALVNSSSQNRFYGTKGHKKAQDFIKERLGENVVEQKFNLNISRIEKSYQNDFDKKIKGKFPTKSSTYKKWNAFTNYMKKLAQQKKQVVGKNYIIELKATEAKRGKPVVIIAHYDTVSHHKETLMIDESEKMPGADYNASGVAVALYLLKELKQARRWHNFIFVFSDAASFAQDGAFHYAKSIGPSNVELVASLEMLGHDSKVQDTTKKYRNFQVYGDKSASSVFSKLNASGKLRAFDFKASEAVVSDHAPFRENGLVFTQNWDVDFNKSRYQTANDFPETLNFSTMSYIAEQLVQAFKSYK